MMKTGNSCPKCGHFQSYRAIVDGKQKRQCAACGYQYTVKKTKEKKPVEVKPEEKTNGES